MGTTSHVLICYAKARRDSSARNRSLPMKRCSRVPISLFQFRACAKRSRPIRRGKKRERERRKEGRKEGKKKGKKEGRKDDGTHAR